MEYLLKTRNFILEKKMLKGVKRYIYKLNFSRILLCLQLSPNDVPNIYE